MVKEEFLAQLRKGLAGLPQEDIEERVTFYQEMIEDRMEEGLSEEDAVSGIGSVAEILSQIKAEIPKKEPAQPPAREKKALGIWTILLLVLGSPIWLSLLLSGFAVVFSLYASLWAVVVSLWAVFGSLIACALAGLVSGIGFALSGHPFTGIAVIGAGVVCGGLSIFLFYGCQAVTKGTLWLATGFVLWLRNRFLKGRAKNG